MPVTLNPRVPSAPGSSTPSVEETAPVTNSQPSAQVSNTPQTQTPWANEAPTRTAVLPPSFIHDKWRESTFEGKRLTPASLTLLNNLKAENYGTTTVQLPQPDGSTKSFTVRDMQYDLGGGKIGARFFTVKDHDPASSAALDAFIRKESGLEPDEPLFTLIAYVHPEEHTATLRSAATQMLKTEMGNTHLGAYIGEGKTTNSPGDYHKKTWEVHEGPKPYPANVQLISLQGVKQGLLNKNMLIADSVLNFGVRFPLNYKNDRMNTVDINTTLMFYRDWIKNEPYLKNDPRWATYCAEHKTIVANIGLNVPHNREAFIEIFGAEGDALWTTFKERFKAANGREFTTADETHFEPLWKKEGLTPADIKAPTHAEFDAYQAARFDGTLKSGAYQGYKPVTAGKGMAWKPETTADLMKNFMETYAPFREVGGYASAATMMGFQETISERMGLQREKFMESVLPVMTEVMIAEGMARAPAEPAKFDGWVQQATAGLYIAFGGNPEELRTGTLDPQLISLAQKIMAGVTEAKSQIMQSTKGSATRRNHNATVWLKNAVQDDLEKARALMVSSPDKTEYYSPPAVTNRVVNGMVEKSRFVDIRVIATAIDASHAEP